MTRSVASPSTEIVGTTDRSRPALRAFLVGGGIASLAAAAFLIRDGGIPGGNITILEQSRTLGGSLDGSGSPADGYVLRGGRMFESKYLCTFDLFAGIPTLAGDRSVTEEIHAWNATMQTSSTSRLVRHGRPEAAPVFGLRERHILAIERLAITPEAMLGRSSIAEQFDPTFFRTNFWFMWCSTFAFQPWHSAAEFRRYLLRFAHMVEGFAELKGIMRTVYNQYDSLVRPLVKWLEQHGVRIMPEAEVLHLALDDTDGKVTAKRIVYRRGGASHALAVGDGDITIVTLGSMTEDSSLGSMDEAAVPSGRVGGGAWALWRTIAAGRPKFGNPGAFADHVEESKWISFTATMRTPALSRLIQEFTGNAPGEGGLVTFPDSAWLHSIVVPHQPHFIGQPDDVSVLWGYGLSIDKPGDFVGKPMSAASGRDIMTEVLGHFGFQSRTSEILADATCIPCLMPFITSQFLRREKGDRPQVVPEGSTNLAFVGQFCELPDDTVFTVEYSIRSAWQAVALLLGLERGPPPVYRGASNPRVLYGALRALHDSRG